MMTRPFPLRPFFSSISPRRAVGLMVLASAVGCSSSGGPDGSATGGAPGSGGANGGGASGGASAGGASGGEVATGGAQATGGVTSSGGSASGGAAAGGSATGGAGAATGGDAAGGGAGGGAAGGGSGGGAASDACATPSDLEAEFPECFSVQLQNALAAPRADSAVIVRLADIQAAHADFNPLAFVILDGGAELASQTVDQAPGGSPDEIAFMVDLGASETKSVAIRYATQGTKARSYPQRAQALVSPKVGGSWSGDTYSGGAYMDVASLDLMGHIAHDYDYLRFEGPGWESDRVGYRTYADNRNAMDIFGKKLPDMKLHDIDYVNEDYSTMSAWGMDILKVGDALGIGALGTWEGGAAARIANLQNITIDILESGPIVALLRITYVDWQTASGTVTLTADISITAGSRLSKVVATVSGSLPNLCTGFAKHEGTTLIPAATTAGWNFLANFGLQSIVPDDLGLAVLYHTDTATQVTEDSLNHAVVLSAAGPLTYYFLAAWVQEGGGIANQSEFGAYLNSTVQELDSPVAVTLF